MAIVIEEEQNKSSIAGVMTWFVILVVIVVASYYIFFKAPSSVEIIVPTNFKNIEPLAHINVNPDAVVDQISKLLKPQITPPEPGNAGRPNPFITP